MCVARICLLISFYHKQQVYNFYTQCVQPIFARSAKIITILQLTLIKELIETPIKYF